MALDCARPPSSHRPAWLHARNPPVNEDRRAASMNPPRLGFSKRFARIKARLATGVRRAPGRRNLLDAEDGFPVAIRLARRLSRFDTGWTQLETTEPPHGVGHAAGSRWEPRRRPGRRHRSRYAILYLGGPLRNVTLVFVVGLQVSGQNPPGPRRHSVRLSFTSQLASEGVRSGLARKGRGF
jgi:hypothetical protein